MQSMEEIYRQHAQTVYRYLCSLTGDEDLSEELTQETFAQAVSSIGRFDGSCKVSTWLCAIAKNQLMAYRRRHPLQDSLDELAETGFASSRIALCRELTKKYEEVLRMTVSEAVSYYGTNEPRGEFCICLEPLEQKPMVEAGDGTALISLLKDKGMSSKDIAAVVSEYTGMNKKEAYKIASEL